MTCDEVRELLPEHLLGFLDAGQDASIERHVRGCAACRQELARLEDGLAALAHATHDEEPPSELRERVLTTLREERDEEHRDEGATAPAVPVARRARVSFGIAASVALLVLVGAVAWGASQAQRADRLAADAASYGNLLATLGGEEFHVGTVTPAGDGDMGGQVLLYEGDRAHGWNSWGVLFVHDRGRTGTATATLLAEDGDSLELPELEFEDGEAAVWIVVEEDLSGYDRLTVTDPDGSLLATASIADA